MKIFHGLNILDKKKGNNLLIIFQYNKTIVFLFKLVKLKILFVMRFFLFLFFVVFLGLIYHGPVY